MLGGDGDGLPSEDGVAKGSLSSSSESPSISSVPPGIELYDDERNREGRVGAAERTPGEGIVVWMGFVGTGPGAAT